MGIKEAYDHFNKQLENKFTHFKAARLAIEKINNLKLLVAATEDLEEIRKRQGRATIASMAGVLGLSYFSSRSWFGRFMLGGLGMMAIKMTVGPIYLIEMMDCIAEKPTEAGQAVRAVYLFKHPQHEHFHHYEKLSTEFREYLKLKDK